MSIQCLKQIQLHENKDKEIFNPIRLHPCGWSGNITAYTYKIKWTKAVPIIRISAEQPIWHETISIWHCGGSNGNSAIWRPSGVRAPVWSRAPRIHNWYKEFNILSCKIKAPTYFVYYFKPHLYFVRKDRFMSICV